MNYLLFCHALTVVGLAFSVVSVKCYAEDVIGAGNEFFLNPTDEDFINGKCIRYVPRRDKAHKLDFEWKFTRSGFVIKDGTGKIPSDLVEHLLPEGTTAAEIHGKWKIDPDNAGTLLLTSIKAGDKAGREIVRPRILKTVPDLIRLNIGKREYVFAVEIPAKSKQ